MRKRLYQALPEDSELMNNVRSAVKEKTGRRHYSKMEGDTTGAVTSPDNEPRTDMFSLAENQIDSLYAIYNRYGKEWEQFPKLMCSSWFHSATTTVRMFEWYMDLTKAAWENGSSIAYESATLSMQSILPTKKS